MTLGNKTKMHALYRAFMATIDQHRPLTKLELGTALMSVLAHTFLVMGIDRELAHGMLDNAYRNMQAVLSQKGGRDIHSSEPEDMN